MEFYRPHKKRPSINITSLIDVLFILIIFFMVSSTFKEQPGLELDLPSAKNVQMTEQNELVLFIDEQEKMYFNEQPITREILKNKLDSLAKAKNPPVFVLKADAKVSHGYVIEIIDMIREVGIRKFSIATQFPEKSK